LSADGWWALAYRLVIPFVALCLYAALALLWQSGAHSFYFGALHLVGVEPFSSPFLDIQAVLAAAECKRLGIDVYLSNPCDALGRPHVYSPLWLAITPYFLDTQATRWVGMSLDLLFILSLLVLPRPRTCRDLLIVGSATFSPMTVYALERANNDLLVFLLVLCACLVFLAPRPYRLCSYALYTMAGLLKYYPLVLLVLLARERRRDRAVAIGIIALILVFFGGYYYPELAKALTNIPHASYFADSFSAENLPFGFGDALGDGFSRTTIAVTLLGTLSVLAIARTRHTLRLLEREEFDPSECEIQCLVVGSILLTACFFAGQNINYRGIYFLLVVPGLLHLFRLAHESALRRFWTRMIAAVLFLMWDEFFRRALHTVVAPLPSEELRMRADIFFWLGRELVWWWLVTGLVAITLSCLWRAPSARVTSRLRIFNALLGDSVRTGKASP
jgi:hypothetical protein